MQKRKRNKNSLFSLQAKKITKNFSRRLSSQRTSSVMLIIGLCLILIGGLQSIQAYSTPSFDGELPRIYNTQGLYAPVNISIPSARIDLPIKKTIIQEGKWEVADGSVSHLSTSSNLDVEGNVILYGHNTFDMLGRLHNTKIGDEILLTDSNGKAYKYIVSSIQVVDPTEIDELTRFEGQTVSIYTCTGFADLKRLLIKAKRV